LAANSAARQFDEAKIQSNAFPTKELACCASQTSPNSPIIQGARHVGQGQSAFT
jgi:hypothetical protein